MTKLLCDVMRTLRTGLLGSLLVASYVMSDESAWKWCYHGQCGIQYWLCHYPDCGGLHQSPIDLSYKKADYDKSLVPVELLDWRWDGAVFVLENTGHSIQVDVRPLEGEGTYQFTGGALGASYQLAQFHLHFGDKDEHGSEHTLHGKSFPMEMHLVGYDTQYPGLKEAAVSPRGLAVIGIFFEVCDDDNEEFEKIVSQLDKVAKPGDRVRLDGFSLLKLLPQDCQRGGPADYYRYQGSLTTPPCYEHVQWTILRRTISISHRQMEKFRSGLYESHGNDMADNFRPTQPLNDRVLLRSFRRSNGNAHGNGRKRW